MARPKRTQTVNRPFREASKSQKLTSKATSQRLTRKAAPAKKSKVAVQANRSILQRLQQDLKIRESYISLILGALIVIVAAALVFNYFKKAPGNVGPASQTAQNVEQQQNQTADVTPENLPGSYTVKDGDTLYAIAQRYYSDGFQFAKIAEANKLSDVNTIVAGQVLQIPKIESAQAQTQVSPSPSALPDTTLTADQSTGLVPGGTGGALNQTAWGEKIDSNTYTVQTGDWLSKIAGRAYGDIMAFDRIAKANNIPNPDLIEPGMVLTIPKQS